MYLRNSLTSRIQATILRIAAVCVYAAASGTCAVAQEQEAQYSWTGFYAGSHIGSHWASTKLAASGTDTGFGGLGRVLAAGGVPNPIELQTNGLSGGFQAGYNWQYGAYVVGGETDITWIGKEETSTSTIQRPGFVPVTTTGSRFFERLYTVRGRVGLAVLPQLLVYGTGGLAVGEGNTSIRVTIPTAAPPLNAISTTELKTGWTAGIGVEWALTNVISLKAEYLHYDLGSHSQTINYNYGVNRSSLTETWRDDGDLVHAGLNFRF